MFRYNFFIFFLSIIAFSCSDLNKKRNSEEIKEFIKSREIKKVSDVEILNKGMQLGRIIADSSQQALVNRLLKSIETKGLSSSIQLCKKVATPYLDSLGRSFGARVKRTTRKLRNKDNQADQLEDQLLEAYEYSSEHGLPLNESVQLSDDGNYVLYTKPIMVSSAVCLNCHGNLGEGLSAETDEKIKSLYGDDQAVNYELHQFRGMWSIKLDKKELINAL